MMIFLLCGLVESFNSIVVIFSRIVISIRVVVISVDWWGWVI